MMFILFVVICIIAALAYFKKKLTAPGAVTAVIVASFIAFSFHYGGLILLGIFFISANLFSLLKRQIDEEAVRSIVAKGDCRDSIQVLANGGVPALISLLYYFYPSPELFCAFVTSIAAVNADTWASEIGTLTKQRPIHVLKWKRVPPGTSGAVSMLGTSAAIVGSFVIVGIAIIIWGQKFTETHTLLLALTVAGFLGNVVDTIIGASFQVEYSCSVCGQDTERFTHCGKRTVHKSGVKWMNNDIVNVSCSLVGALLGVAIGSII